MATEIKRDEFLGTWEMIHNPNFKVIEFDHFKMQAGYATVPYIMDLLGLYFHFASDKNFF